LDFAGEWMGLQREAGVPLTRLGGGKSFVKVDWRAWIDEQGTEVGEPDFVLDSTRMPSFISPDDAHTMFETGKSLRFLRSHHPDHALARAEVVASATPPKLDWRFSWQEIEQVENKVLQYERDLLAALQQYSAADSTPVVVEHMADPEPFRLNFFGKPEEDMNAHFLASIQSLGEPLTNTISSDRLSTILTDSLQNDGSASPIEGFTFAPPTSLTPSISFGPIISTQARIVNGACMRLFFNSHKLREHLFLQRQFQLLGNGVFSSRLSHALFDPDLETAERQAGVARTGGVMGLRLGGRDTWPPASSELRLALMGVLTDSYISTGGTNQDNAGSYLDRKGELPGDLSFAVREMSQDEIDRCLNPNSIEALDFLRLSYKPPPPLEVIITPICLYKYDQLFKLLLRVLRMLYAVNQLFRDATDRTSYWQGVDPTAQRFRIEAHHFVSSVCGYFFDTGIDATWRIFERKLDEVEERLGMNDGQAALGEHEGLDKLRGYHEKVLDRIMFALLLRKRQQPVMKLLEEIFSLVLEFAKHSRERAEGVKRKVGMDAEVRDMYVQFRKKVGVFITVCRGLSERRGYGEGKDGKVKIEGRGGLFSGEDLVEDNTVAQLLARLEISNYYSRTVDL